ncbi:MAG: B12-binding domain-containing radical SAM protein [Flavisolibacter sp.]
MMSMLRDIQEPGNKHGSILFTHSYFLRFDPKQWKTGKPYAPLGTLYAASLMREKGYSVSLHDVQFSQSPDEVMPVLETIRPQYFVIYDDGFNYLTKMCLTNMREAAFRMISHARQHNCIVIVSSSDATDHADKYLDAGAHFVIYGEAEQTLAELTSALDAGEEDVTMIAGLVYRKNGAEIKTLRRKVITDLDSLPVPAWDLVNFEPYRKMWMKHAGYFSINIGTTRGCPFKCNWCAKPIYGNRYNARSPQNVLNEIIRLKQITDFEHIWFCDDIFGLKPGWVNEFAALVKENKLHFRFKIQSRADLLVQENYVAALERAGCENVWMGAESGSQKILDAMDKGITVEQIRKATALLKQHNIQPSFFIQFGYPGETRDDIFKTIQLINEQLPHDIGISVSYPLPGTSFYEKVKSELMLKANWTDSDEMALMFRNTYSAPYYKQLHRYVHRNYRKHLAFDSLRQFLKKPFHVKWEILKSALSGVYFIPVTAVARIRLKQFEKAG